MNKEVKDYLMNHTIEEITSDWNEAQKEKTNKFKAWLNVLETKEQEGDEMASYLLSTALRCFFGLADDNRSMEDSYTDENLKKTKEYVISALQYDATHGSKKEREEFKNVLNTKLEKYQLK